MKSLLSAKLGSALFFTIALVAAVVQLRLAVQYFSPEVAGAWLLAMTFGAYALVLDLGFSPTFTREMSYASARSPAGTAEKRRGELLSAANRLFLVLATLVFVLAAPLGAYLLSGLVPEGDARAIVVAWLFYAFGLALVVRANGYLAILDGLGQIALARAIKSAAVVGGVALLIAFLETGLGVASFGYAMGLQGAIQLLPAWWHCRTHAALPRQALGAPAEVIRELTPPSLRWAAMQLGTLLIMNTGNVVIAYQLTVSAIPSYEALMKVCAAIQGFAMVLVGATVPLQSRLHAAGSTEARRAIMFHNARFAPFIVATLGVAFALNAEAIVAAWLGPGVRIDPRVAWTLAAVVTLESHHVALAFSAIAAGHVVFAVPALLAGALNVTLALALAPILDTWGVALALLLAQMATSNWYVPFYALRLFAVGWRRYAREVLAPMVAAVAAMAIVQALVVTAFAREFPKGTALLSIGLAGMAVLVATYRFMRLPPSIAPSG